MNLKNLLTRSLSGIIYTGAIVGCIFWGHIPFTCLIALFGALAVVEYDRMCGNTTDSPYFFPALFLDIAGVVCLTCSAMIFPVFIWIFIMISRMIMELYLRANNSLDCLSHSLSSQIYIGLPLGCLVTISYFWNLHIVLAIFLMIWINDTGAFLVGCTLGRHRLFERISPKKSWEGFFGGLAFNLLAAWLFCIGGRHFWGMNWNVITWLLFGCTITIFSTWGDLIESQMKRSRNLKDSGNLIPGHGGILDRIDSLLLVMPASLLFILIASLIFADFDIYNLF